MRNKTLFIRLFTLLSFLTFHSFTGLSQKSSFVGMLEYKINVRDTVYTSLFPEKSMFLYTNDTIVRTENYSTQLGDQAVLRHMEKNKSYLLLNTPMGKFAIQTDLNIQDTTDAVSKYTYKKKCGKRKVLGRKAKRMIVTHPDFPSPIEFLYYPKIDKKYHNTFDGIPGLPVKYSIPTADGVFDYELVKFSEFSPNRDLFGVPSDYERMSFDDFLERVVGKEPSEELKIKD